MSVLDGKSSKTMTRILNSAEELFIEHGFEATSLRNITQRAKVNLAAVNYHFGSKEALIKAVFVRRFIPYLNDCEQALQNLLEQPKPYTTEQLIAVLLQPALEMATAPDKHGLTLTRLISRMMVDNHNLVRETCSQQIDDIFRRYTKIVSESLPDIDPEVISWRIHFSYNLLFHAFSGNNILTHFTPGAIGSARDPQRISIELARFIAGGLTNPN